MSSWLVIGGGGVGFDVVGNGIRDHRVGRGLSQAELATAMGVSRQTINSLEAGRYVPSLGLAIGLARFFGSTVEEMFHVKRR